MMKKTCFSIALLLSSSLVFADKKIKYRFNPSDFKIHPVNSPVKEFDARFKLELPEGFVADELKIKIVNSQELTKGQKNIPHATILGNELKVPVSRLPPGFYRLYVKLKDKKTQKEHSYSSALHDFVRFEIDSSLEVANPDPEKNNLTLKGIDSDNDGIRDDVQRYINIQYPSPNLKAAARQIARVYQTSHLNVKDKESAFYYAGKEMEANKCLVGITTQWLTVGRDIREIFKNTETRIKKSLEIDQLFHGGTTPKSITDFQASGLEDKTIFCDFEPVR